MKRFCLPFALSASLTLLANPGYSAMFSDLPDPSMQAAASVLAKRQVMQSLSPSEWGIQNPITRIELAQILDNLLDPRDIPFQVMLFNDVPLGHRGSKSVNKVVCFGILPANGATFHPNQRVSRVDLLQALDKLLSYRSILPPPRRKTVAFPDVKRGNPAFVSVDRGANHWQLVENPEFIRFRPYEAVTRGEAAIMILHAASLIDRSFEEDFHALLPKETPAPEPTEVLSTPAPTPTTENKETPKPTPSESGPPEWLVSPSPSPTEETPNTENQESPTPAPLSIPPQRGNHFALDPLCFLVVMDSLSSSSQNGTGFLSTLHLGGHTWVGDIGLFADLNTTVMPGSLDSSSKSTAYSSGAFSNFMVHVAGLYPLPWKGPVWDVSGGVGAYLRASMADSSGFWLGIGPAVQGTYRQPTYTLTGGLQLHPLVLGSSMGFGINPSCDLTYPLMKLAFGDLSLHAGFNGQYDLGYTGGSGALTAAYVGAGLKF